MSIAQIRKAIVAGIVAGVGAFTALKVDGAGTVEVAGWITVAVASVVAFVGTFTVPNAPKPPAPPKAQEGT